MRHLFNLFAVSAFVQSGINPKIDPCLVGDTCNSTKTTEDCIICWGPERGYPPIPDANVTEQCFTNPPPDGLGCCPDDKSPTKYSDCAPPPPPPEWKGCGDEESLSYCNASVVAKNSTSIDQCFEKEECCEDKESPTQYADCPPTSFPEYAKFLLGELGALVGGAVVQTRAHLANLSEITKTAGWMALGAGMGGGIGTGIGKAIDDRSSLEEDKDSMVPLLSTIGMAAGLIGFGITAYRHYKAVALAQPGREPLHRVELL